MVTEIICDGLGYWGREYWCQEDFLADSQDLFANCLDCNRIIPIRKNKKRCSFCANLAIRRSMDTAGRKRRAIKSEIVEVYTQEQWFKKRDLTKGICPGCGEFVGTHKLTLDHIYPISKAKAGRIYTIDDIQPLCKSCNSRKSNKIESIINKV